MWADAVEFNVPSDVLNVRSDLLVNNAFSDDVYPDARSGNWRPRLYIRLRILDIGGHFAAKMHRR